MNAAWFRGEAMDDNLAGEDETDGTRMGACGLYREVPVRLSAPTSGSTFAERQAELSAQQPALIGSSVRRGRRPNSPAR